MTNQFNQISPLVESPNIGRGFLIIPDAEGLNPEMRGQFSEQKDITSGLHVSCFSSEPKASAPF
jgi:hypothetical protein